MQLTKFRDQTFPLLSIRRHTLETYKSVYKVHIGPYLGHKELDEITRSEIKSCIASLSPQTAATTLAVIKTLFREALENGVLEKSPVHGVRGPKVFVAPRRFLTWEEIERINFGKWNHHIRFLALHGLRWSEAVALSHEDVRDKMIFITKSVHGPTKSLAGMRTVPLIEEFRVFPKHPRTLRNPLAIHGISVHSLRHTYAYILKKQGVHVTTAQRLLGHSDPKITLSIYTRVLDSEIVEVGQKLSAMSRLKGPLIGNE